MPGREAFFKHVHPALVRAAVILVLFSLKQLQMP